MKGLLRPGLGAALVAFLSIISPSLQALDSFSDDACGKAAKELNIIPFITAQSAYDCLTAIPFHKDEALNLVQQLRLYLQFYSAQAYFHHPPTLELELNPVDMNGTLDRIEGSINAGDYHNEYSFNKDLFNLFGDYRDGHVSFMPYCYVTFIFMHVYSLVSIAETPDGIPEIYSALVESDIFEVGDKVIKINDENAVDYLINMANSHPELSWVDPDARFNQLLAGKEGGSYKAGTFAFRQTYDDEPLVLTWENGTKTEVEWHATMIEDASTDWHSDDTFYKKVCLRTSAEMAAVLYSGSSESIHWIGDEDEVTDGNNDHHHHNTKRDYRPKTERQLRPISERQTTDDDADDSTESIYSSKFGEIKLYVLDDETGVLVVSSFMYDDLMGEANFIHEFSGIVTESITYLHENGITKLIIDLSGNNGGLVILGEDMAAQLFPEADHFHGSNMRWNPALDAMLTMGSDPNTTWWDIGHYHKIDGSDFASYREFLGPVHRDDDYFTMIARPDNAEAIVEYGDSGLSSSYSWAQPFDTDNIAILTNGACGSTCALLAEALLEQGVHSVAFGGRPRVGPMQTVGGIKGSQVLSFDSIVYWASRLLGDLSRYDFIPEVLPIKMQFAAINLRNSWRKEDQDVPIEFIYDPAQYKLSYTREMLTNDTLIWQATKDVVWGDLADLSGDGAGDEDGDDDSGSVTYGPGGIMWNSIGELIWMKLDGRLGGLAF